MVRSGYTFLGYCVSACDVPQWLKPEDLISFAAGLRPSKPKAGLPGAPKDLLHPAGGTQKMLIDIKACNRLSGNHWTDQLSLPVAQPRRPHCDLMAEVSLEQ